ncbi:MAG TPA: carotenoid 1,2-hydratase [Aquabacterium sp.]|uniref:lipocalin-like domain-containing protein n=1 Tax=Aquabacterium sp. TaxID=1872578 RepID=UPI002DA34719|nr:carotenoid 1,2-hydratase [Aquabacterium sp.]HET6789592.1 carotenoid 1,2-hydratase [Aquabacterium sp.]HEX5372971.1 carotenoid 1,2-hydratase [Aquabacterium sp.]
MIDRRHCLMQWGWHLGALGALGASGRVGAGEPTRHLPRVRPGQPLHFPRDFGAHPEFRTEWWYITGQLGRDLGFQITFFRSRVDTAQDNPSRLAARQLILAHAALTDVRAGQLLHEQRIAREGLGLAGAALGDTHVHLRSWSLQRSGTAAQSLYQARVDAQDFRLSLALRTTQPLLLQGDAGYSRKGPLPTQSSHYYTQPHLAVNGQLTLGGQTRTVTGRAWMDHEWSESLLAPDAVGWDWIGMNLHDGTALTAFRLRRADGSIRWAGGSWRPPGQAARHFGPDELRFTPGRRWRSPTTQATYPVEWQIDTPVGRFAVRARLDAQELAGQPSTGTVYWEGLCELIDAQQRVIGSGYLEMTGYADKLTL